jgi:hypothetical protein
MRIEPWGFIVLEACDQYEQVLALDVSKGMPEGGILTWSSGRLPRVFFPTRKAAREAIRRTEHYRLAFGRTDLPEKANCRVELIAAVQDAAHDKALGERST